MKTNKVQNEEIFTEMNYPHELIKGMQDGTLSPLLILEAVAEHYHMKMTTANIEEQVVLKKYYQEITGILLRSISDIIQKERFSPVISAVDEE